MSRPNLWLSAPGTYRYRVDFRFVDISGKLLRTKSWELRQDPQEETRVYTLQANAKWVAVQPKLVELGCNYVGITAVVADLEGELHTTSLPIQPPEIWHAQLAAFPISFGITLSAGGIKFTLHTAKPKIS